MGQGSEGSNKKQTFLSVLVALLVGVVALESYLLYTKRSDRQLIQQVFSEKEGGQSPLESFKEKFTNPFGKSLPTERDFFAEMRTLQRRIDMMFQDSFMHGFHEPYPMEGGFPLFDMEIDLVETSGGFEVTCDIPGLDKSALQIYLQGNILTIQGERDEQKENQKAEQGWISRERHFGSFSRSLSLPSPVDPNSVKAEYKNGVLKIQIKKLDPDMPEKTRIDII